MNNLFEPVIIKKGKAPVMKVEIYTSSCAYQYNM